MRRKSATSVGPRSLLPPVPISSPPYEMRDIGPYGVWTTIVVRPTHPIDRPMRGFNYSVGGNIPGMSNVTACRSDTNLNVAGCFMDDTMRVESVAWRIPALALGKFQHNGKDYHVTCADVAELVRSAHLTVHTNRGDVVVPLAYLEADAVGGHGATYDLSTYAFDLKRMETFWVELSFKEKFKIKGALPIIVTFDGLRSRGVS